MKKSEDNNTALESKSRALVNSEGDSSSNHLIAFNMQKRLFSTITELDRRYKEAIRVYSETLQRYNVDIEKLKSEIALKEKDVAKAERELIADETLIEYESKNFEKLHNDFTKQISILTELIDEYKDILSEGEYRKKVASKKRTLLDLLEDISEKESLLLNRELERLNHYSRCKEQKKAVEKLRNELKELELEKGYFESTELQKITALRGDGLSDEDRIESLSDVVETEVIGS